MRSGDYWGVAKRYSSYEHCCSDPNIDAVHINSPFRITASSRSPRSKAGKHVACTVPMATSVDDCLEIIRLTQETGLKYMMMETVVYAREYLFMKELRDSGELGKVQFIQASHQQDMDGWPNYWPGLPPMWYATHCVGPRSRARRRRRGIRELLWQWNDPRRTRDALRFILCH
jgi:predicted dehydrogenase